MTEGTHPILHHNGRIPYSEKYGIGYGILGCHLLHVSGPSIPEGDLDGTVVLTDIDPNTPIYSLNVIRIARNETLPTPGVFDRG